MPRAVSDRIMSAKAEVNGPHPPVFTSTMIPMATMPAISRMHWAVST